MYIVCTFTNRLNRTQMIWNPSRFKHHTCQKPVIRLQCRYAFAYNTHYLFLCGYMILSLSIEALSPQIPIPLTFVQIIYIFNIFKHQYLQFWEKLTKNNVNVRTRIINIGHSFLPSLTNTGFHQLYSNCA